jgi:TolB-like protein
MIKTVLTFFLVSFAAVAGAEETIAVLDLRPGAGVNVDECAILTERLIAELTNTGGFTVMDRGARDARLDQMAYEQTGMVGNEIVAQVGKELGVNKMATGTVGRLGQTWTVSVRLIDVNRGVSERSVTRDYRGEIDALLGVMREIAGELAGIIGPADVARTVQGSRAYAETYFTSSSGVVVPRDIESWMDRDNLRYDTRSNGSTWDLGFSGSYGQEFSLIVGLRSNDDGTPTYITFWALLQYLPDNFLGSKKKMKRLTDELLAVGYSEYLVKAVIDTDGEVGVQVELPAEGANYDSFSKALWRCVNSADNVWLTVENSL